VIMVTHDPKAAAFGSRSIHLEKGELVNGDSGLSNPTCSRRRRNKSTTSSKVGGMK